MRREKKKNTRSRRAVNFRLESTAPPYCFRFVSTHAIFLSLHLFAHSTVRACQHGDMHTKGIGDTRRNGRTIVPLPCQNRYLRLDRRLPLRTAHSCHGKLPAHRAHTGYVRRGRIAVEQNQRRRGAELCVRFAERCFTARPVRIFCLARSFFPYSIH